MLARIPVQMRFPRLKLAVAVAAAFLLLSVRSTARPALAQLTFTVTTTADSGPGSLRQAILDSNASGEPDANVIEFDIEPGGVQTIALTSPLPQITATVEIDGTSQPGFSGTPIIVLDGSAAGAAANGLDLETEASTVRGLVIGGFSYAGIYIGGFGNTIAGNYVGTDAGGTVAHGNGTGVEIDNGGSDNIIGGTTAADRNVISGNSEGVILSPDGYGTTGNVVEGNYIGTNAAGDAALPNQDSGVQLANDGGGIDRIGGMEPGAGNVISGNGSTGVYLDGRGFRVEGNLIGTDATGAIAVGNGYDGVFIGPSSRGNVIGGTAPGAGNVISGNDVGVGLDGDCCPSPDDDSPNVVEGNRIGTNAAGAAALPNLDDGVLAQDNGALFQIGGTATRAGNVISGNGVNGVHLDFANGYTIEGNLIGTDATGAAPLGNSQAGVLMDDVSTDNIVGGTAAGARNVISANDVGIQISWPFGQPKQSAHNQIQGNYIGTDVTGEVTTGNASIGVFIDGGDGNTVGGDTSEAGNLITGNDVDGVFVQGNDNVIGGANRITGNNGPGVEVWQGFGNAITTNSIVDNGDAGIVLDARREQRLRLAPAHRASAVTYGRLNDDQPSISTSSRRRTASNSSPIRRAMIPAPARERRSSAPPT